MLGVFPLPRKESYHRRKTVCPPRVASAPRSGLPQRQFAQQRRQQRQLLVEFAQYEQHEQRVERELQFQQCEQEQQQPLQRTLRAASVPIALIHYDFHTLS